MTTLAETIVQLPRIQGKVKIEILSGYHEPCWRASRETLYGWEKIPAMSGAECRRFPLTIAKAAQAFLEGYRTKMNNGTASGPAPATEERP